MGCGASLPSDADFKDQTIHGNETRHSYEMKLRMSLITKFERPDKYSNVDVTELAIQSEDQASKVENFVDQGYRWKKDAANSNIMDDLLEERRRDDRIKLRRTGASTSVAVYAWRMTQG
ncbi:Uncharacterized protein SCF082_LOCUS3496 [Durusdinium trenchii]|uniref:Uncharacterized protein n=1 Tax=Durusdinium trenchii TaxID=1381693 RepID=A0ABP0HT86_9DINO